MKRLFLCIYILGVASFFATTVGISVAGNLRFYMILPLLVLAIIKSAHHPTRISANIIFAMLVFLSWCLLTCFWSENFTMSFVKLGMFGGAALAFCLGGMLLPADHPDLNPYLAGAPIFCYVVIGSILHPEAVQGNLKGVAGNSNHLGACILFSSPWYLAELQRKWSNKSVRVMLILLGLAALVLLVFTRSRAMMVSLVASSLFLFLSLKPGRKILLVYSIVAAVALSLVFIPQFLSTVRTTYVLKSGNSLLESRGEQMEESFRFAKQGGVLGAGFGVSVGKGRYWEWGSTFTEYNREKGNSAFAVVEEIGVVGLALWLALLLVIAVEVRSLGRQLIAGSNEHFLYLITLGFLLAAFVGSMAEAWVLSPSPETAVFWATIGLSIGALKRGSERLYAFGSAAQ